MKLFYASLIWSTRFLLALALAAPVRNHENIRVLKEDEQDYERALARLELGL